MPSRSPSRAAQDTDERAYLLPPPNTDVSINPEATRSASGYSSWQFWRRDSTRARVTFADDDEHGEGLSTGGQPIKAKYLRWPLYVLLVLVGMAIGSLIRGGLPTKADSGMSKGPRVPPVEYLPPPSDLPRNPSYIARGQTAAVASDERTCSAMGLTILQDHNGTAVDAAITTALCTGLLNAMSSGIGGGGFMVVRVPEGAPLPGDKEKAVGVWALDFREVTPSNGDKYMFGANHAGREAAQVGGLAIGVPGELRGLEAAHKLYGRLPWEELVMPVVELSKGWRCSRELARRLRIFGRYMLDDPTWSDIYAPRGYHLVEGDWMKRLNYGRTLEQVAEHGADAFYHGAIAENMVKEVEKQGGILNTEDLANYKAIKYLAIHQTYHDKTIYTTFAPSSGALMMGILNILEPYNIQLSGGLSNPLNMHRFVEAMKFGFGARSEICDPKFAVNTSRFHEFYSKEWATEIREKMTDNTTHEAGFYGLEHDTPADHGTTHLSVTDQWGGAVAMTSTVNLIWGSRVMDPETGVIFNDELDDFAVPDAPDAFGLQPSPWNYPAPGKRPLSSTSATIILNEDSSLYGVFGGSGGSYIFPAVAQVILNLEAGMELETAIEAYRIHDQIVPIQTTLETGPEGLDQKMIKALEDRGHRVKPFDVNIGVVDVQGIIHVNGTVWAHSDSRKNGVAAAY